MRQCASLLLVVSSTLAWAPHRRPAGSRTALRSTLSPDRASILARRFWEVDMQTRKRIDRVLEAFRAERLDASAFNGVDGYGYGDVGREKLDGVVARLMGAEAALVRLQLFSGTHAISRALFGALRTARSSKRAIRTWISTTDRRPDRDLGVRGLRERSSRQPQQTHS